jgi:hypothetical protein
VLSFSSSRRNLGSPNPSPAAGECAPPPPPPGSRGMGTLASERVVGSVLIRHSDEGTYTVVLFIYMYFVGYTLRWGWGPWGRCGESRVQTRKLEYMGAE